MRPFAYAEPTTLAEAIGCLASAGGAARPFAGGTDILPRLRRGVPPPAVLVNLKRIAVLRGIAEEDDVLSVGALATLEDLLASEAIRRRHPVLWEAARRMASPQVRALATVGGNLANASPAADLAPPLLCLGAEVVVEGPGGRRAIPLRDFFRGPGETALGPAEILVRVRVPAAPSRGVFLKFSPRAAMDLAIVSVACVVGTGRPGRDGGPRVALGAVAPTPILVPPSPEAAAAAARPIGDLRASAEYRRALVAVLVRRALEAVAA